MISVLLDTAAKDKDNKFSFLFINPRKIITCQSSNQLDPCLSQLTRALKKGWYAAGFISYEAGWHLQSLGKTNRSYSFPLLWFGLFNKPIIINNFHEAMSYLAFPAIANCSAINQLQLNTTRKKYCQDIARIRGLIAQGQTYQVNYTMKYKFNFTGSPLNLYRRLRAIQPVSYGAFINTGDSQILSFSPELFFRRNKNTIFVQPMKGTAALSRHTNLADDPKNQAENIMITDLMRNDLGKISNTGSVRTYDVFKTHKYSTLWQMTSSVQSHLLPKISWRDIFSSLFPCGSVTGAPKLSTMNIIKSLEKEERNIYTGAIGYIGPEQQAVFNVAIRTVLLRQCQGEMGVGGGITWDSDPKQEWEECKLKGAFLTKSEFQLIETMTWSAHSGIPLIKLHLHRLKRSAEFFGFPYYCEEITRQLAKVVRTLAKKDLWKIRLLLKNDGAISVNADKIFVSASTALKVAISAVQTNPDDPFLQHKTTERTLYDQELAYYKKRGYYDVLFTNNRGEITEGAISNIFIKKGPIYYTPPLKCGLLPGVYRGSFIRQHRKLVIEKPLCLGDLHTAEAIFLTNAVRGLVQVKLDE